MGAQKRLLIEEHRDLPALRDEEMIKELEDKKRLDERMGESD